MKLVKSSKSIPLLPLDDIYITGVLRHSISDPAIGLKLINSFDFGGADFLEWALHCPFMGVAYYALLQDLAFQRDYWPWGALKEVSCIALEQFLGLTHFCDAKTS